MNLSAIDHLIRVSVKVVMASLITAMMKAEDYASVFAFWIAMYAMFAIFQANMSGQKILDQRITFWDQAAWLAGAAVVVRIGGSLLKHPA